ncbi:hypothetical protein AJ79_09397 [Helicocarpus griseus UAMH5409]|uniref:Uncharacterized protein n=1 Tax=Helicocarpus griseus UAMH5409 TaxID=1447875 RepID=A0A2B7WK53_9EURO|nr:hypothetical protein AJ79_09397 [Helicocarpus griseus UAMH5409]
MPPDKQTGGQSAKPFTPTMRSSYRPTKNPLTPKLAGYTPSRTPRKPESGQRTAVSRPEPTSSHSGTLLSANVTPRSGPRLSRRDGNTSSVETSPSSHHPLRPVINSVPQTAPPPDTAPKHDGNALSMPRLARAKSVANDTQHLTPHSRPTSSCDGSAGSPMFFHADDTRSPPPASDMGTRRGSLQRQGLPTTFLYANGTTSENAHRDASRSTTPFDKTPRLPPPKQLEVVVPTRPKQPSNGLPRDSPIYRHDQSPASPHPPSAIGQDSPQDRRPSSFDGSKRPSHTKSSSMDASQYAKRRKQDLVANLSASPHLTSSELQHLAGATPPESSPKRIVSACSSASIGSSVATAGTQSPPKEDPPRNTEIDKMNELAANARRERKVLDLEISNSSLLAINRTLEREMRKQSAELRRYRRLTRSGRLSMTEPRSVSGGNLSIVSETDDEPSDMSLVDNANEDLSDSSDNESSASDDCPPGPDNKSTEHDAKHRTRDEKRFILDLTKHQQLLIDSQKMNQSIKRCLGWTESLILEGKKALDYHVQVSDIDIGGRVLAPDEIEGETEGGRGLLSPTAGIAGLYSPTPMNEHLSPSEISLPDSD